MSDSQGPNATAQALTKVFEKIIEVDPRRLVREYELENLRAVLRNSEKAVEASKGKKVKDDEISPEALRAEAASQVAECEAALVEYDAEDDPHNRAVITIGYIPEDVLTEYDLKDQSTLSMEIGSQKRNAALHELDRLLVKHGVKDHSGVVFSGIEIPFTEELGVAAIEVLDLYSRAKWLKALRWAIYKFNSLAEEKKSR